MSRIPLTQGKVATVDTQDFARVSKFKWHAVKKPGSFYAARSERFRGKKRSVWMHQFILRLYGAQLIDHRNGDGLDNTRKNLRPCSQAENIRNSRKRTPALSKFKGVTWDNIRGVWWARILGGGKRRHLGYFSSQCLAARAYDAAAKKYFGEFAALNFP